MRGTDMTGWIMKEHNVPESLVTVLKLAIKKVLMVTLCGNVSVIVVIYLLKMEEN